MASAFVQTLRSLDQRERWVVWLVPALLLLSAWAAWLGCARVSVYAAAKQARIEVAGRANRVSAEQGGRIVRLSGALGQQVAEGEVVALIDSSVEIAQLERQRSELSGLTARIAALETQISAEQSKRSARARVDELSLRQADLALQEAHVVARHREELASIADDLHQRSVGARLAAVEADVQRRASLLRVDGAGIETKRVQAQRDYDDRSELARLAELERMLTELHVQQTVAQAGVDTARAELARRSLRAPASGRLGNIAELQVGDVVKPGDVIATVVPTERMQVVAEFAPDDAVGRIQLGAPARVRLLGFSFTEYGSLDARVTRLANEPDRGTIRVELALVSQTGPLEVVQHGLPALVDVVIDDVSPWSLMLRAIGSRLTRSSVHSQTLL